MNADVRLVLVSAVVATFNPSLLAATTMMLLLPNPRRLMLGYLLGAYTTSLVAGIVIVLTLHGSGAASTSSRILGPGAEIALGALALGVALMLVRGRDAALRTWRRQHLTITTRPGPKREPWHTRMLKRGSAAITFAVGAAMSFPGVSYVNALDHIAHLNPPTVPLLALITYFCAMQQILLEAALLASFFASEWTQGVIVRFRAWLTGHGRQIGTAGLFGLGMLLAGRGILAIA